MMRQRSFPLVRHGLAAAIGTLVFAAAVGGAPAATGAPASSPSSPDAEVAFPKPPPAGRYEALGARSPFAPPTAAAPVTAAPPPPPPPIWAEKYSLGSVAQFGPGFRVTLTPKNPTGGANASPAERVVVITGEPNAESITIGNVQWSDQAGQTRVTLVKSGVPGVFTFDNSALSPGVTAPNAARVGGGGNAPNAVAPMIPPRAGNPMPPPFQPPPALPPGGIVAPGNIRAPIRSGPPAASPSAPRVVLPSPQFSPPSRQPVPIPGNTAQDDDDD